jgi:heterodisulfide reductase subunit A
VNGPAARTSERIGVYVCRCGTNIAASVDVAAVTAAAAGLDGVVAARESRFLCGAEGQELIRKEIREQGLTRVVVAACSPWLHERTFGRACAAAGLSPFALQIANIREQVAWVTPDREEATGKARAVVTAAVRRVELQRPLEPRRVPVTQSVMVVGAGIAGVEASLRLADAGVKVVLVERQPSIGGHMAMLDRTFPTLDCSACVLMPKLTEVVEHPNITLLSYSELVGVSGSVGNFRARVRRKARYIDAARCNGCGACIEQCLSREAPSAFDLGRSTRPAIHFAHAHALPRLPLIDPTTCHCFDGVECEACRGACAADAIDFAQRDEEVEFDVGAVIVATGFQLFDPAQATQYGYGRWSNVITSLEFERLCHPAGPTGGRIELEDGRRPESVAILHCVGSRDVRFNRYCSRVCCTAALKTALTVRERTGARVFNFYVDMRAAGKECEEFFERVQRSGAVFILGKGTEVIARAGKLLVKAEDTLLGRRVIVPVDLVVLMVGMEPDHKTAELARLLKLSCSDDGFLMARHIKMAPAETAVPGIFLAGACQSPRDITDSVSHGAAAAAAALDLLAPGTVELPATVATVEPALCSGCELCLGECPQGALAIESLNGRSVARVDAVLCNGCGSCVSTCPAGAIDQLGFTRGQLAAEIEGLLAASPAGPA